MKRRDLLRRLAEEGCQLMRNGAGHDLYRNVITGAVEAVPRHAEVNEYTARKILLALSAPPPGER